MTCGPCKDAVDCLDAADDEDEFEALTELYNRLFEKRDGGGAGQSEPAAVHSSACECALAQPDSKPKALPRKLADYCADGPSDDTVLKRADRLMTALLRERKDPMAASAEGDVKHLTAKVPAFRTCKMRKPAAVNAALFGLDLEHWMSAATAGDGRDDGVKRAAYNLAAAEAHCKHAGAVEAAELAVHVEPAEHLAEVAARFGAQTFASSAESAGRPGQESGDDTPVVVVAYVGNTTPLD